ncbi:MULTISPECIES: type 1 glutamine amidotransferase domain-containing protein [unclassified Luteococcus]|uniref:type 1 glutamine amidotransferase domain-containing protein n=1 Tax=unclassified Luteococcus TaxID=2639923 RepID=UPI00313AD07D
MFGKKKHGRILAIVTSVAEYQACGYRTGLWLGELTHFVDVAEKAGHEVDVVSIAGGDVPLDPESLMPPVLALGETGKRYRDREFMDRLRGTKSVRQVRAEDYDAIYLTGGHGTMFDFDDAHLAELVAEFWSQEKVVSAVCHGPAGLLQAEVAGQPLLKGRKVTGFSWAEEKLAQRDDVVPYKLQDELKERGAKYTKALRPMAEKVVTDGNLVTGQNPMSATGVAKAVVSLLAKRR